MKATGIIRRIDDLGRVVIPREIRRSLHLREGEPLEIFVTEEGGVIFQPYKPDLVREIRNIKDEVEEAFDCIGNLAAIGEIKSHLEKAAKLVDKLESED